MGDASVSDVFNLLREAEDRSGLIRNVDNLIQTLSNPRMENASGRQSAATQLRILLRRPGNFPISVCFRVGDAIMKNLNDKADPVFIQTALCILSSLINDSPTVCHHLIRRNLINRLTGYVDQYFDCFQLKCKCISVLSVIAECCSSCCQQVVQQSFKTVFNCLKRNPENERSILIYIVAVHTMFRPDGGGPKVGNSSDFVNTLMHIYHRYKHQDIRNNVIYSLMQWLSLNPTKEYASVLMNYPNIMKTLINFFHSHPKEEGVPILRIMGHLIYAEDDYVNAILETNIITAIRSGINTYSTRMKVETLWFLSNVIAVRDRTVAQSIVEKLPDLWDTFIRCAYARSFKLRREAMFCIINALSVLDESFLKKALYDFFGRLVIDTFEGFNRSPWNLKHIIERPLMALIRERIEMGSSSMIEAAFQLRFYVVINDKINDYMQLRDTVNKDTVEYKTLTETIEDGKKCLSVLRQLEVMLNDLTGNICNDTVDDECHKLLLNISNHDSIKSLTPVEIDFGLD